LSLRLIPSDIWCVLVMPQVHLGIAGPTAYYVMWMTGYNTVSLALAARCPTPHSRCPWPLLLAAGKPARALPCACPCYTGCAGPSGMAANDLP